MPLKPLHIKVALVRNNKTGKEVAAAVGLSPSSFSRLIHGHRNFDPSLLEAIEQAIRSPRASSDEPTPGNEPTPKDGVA
jgi:transcriptional regulator with XRE-family HTH domain